MTKNPRLIITALSDPTRFEVLSRLTEVESASATNLAKDMPVSRQAVLKHLTALSEAGLVTRMRAGREVRWEYSPGSLDELAAWADSVGSEWDRRLQRLKREIG